MENESAENKVKDLDEMMGINTSMDTRITIGGEGGGNGMTTAKESNWDSLSPAGLAESSTPEPKAQLGASLS